MQKKGRWQVTGVFQSRVQVSGATGRGERGQDGLLRRKGALCLSAVSMSVFLARSWYMYSQI